MTTSENARLTFVGNTITLRASQCPISLELETLPIAMLTSNFTSRDWVSALDAEMRAFGLVGSARLSSAAAVPVGVFNKPDFVDYGSPSVYFFDRDHSRKSAEAEAPPNCVAVIPEGASFKVPTSQMEVYGGALYAVAAIVATVFKNREDGDFFGYSCIRRLYPSIGARHGFEVALSLSCGDELTLAYFSPVDDAFYFTLLPGAVTSSIRLVVYVHWQRYFWRYRDSWYYNAVLLEMGHMLACLEVLSQQYGIQFQVCERVPFSINPLDVWASPLLVVDANDTKS